MGESEVNITKSRLDKVFDLVTNVGEKLDDSFVYSILLNENKKIKASPPLGLLLKASNRVLNASDKIISQPTDSVKSENSERNEDSMSNRAILANAIESSVQTNNRHSR